MIEPTNPLRFAGDLAYEKGADQVPKRLTTFAILYVFMHDRREAINKRLYFVLTVAQRDPHGSGAFRSE